MTTSERREEEAIRGAYLSTAKRSCIRGPVGVTFAYMENASTLWEEMAKNTVGKVLASLT